MHEDTQRLLRDLKDEIAIRCYDIEQLCRGYGLPLSKITVIARDPANDNMYTVVTNESESGLAEACALALKPPATITT